MILSRIAKLRASPYAILVAWCRSDPQPVVICSLPLVISAYQTRVPRRLFRPVPHPIGPRTCLWSAEITLFSEQSWCTRVPVLWAELLASTMVSIGPSRVPPARVLIREHLFSSSWVNPTNKIYSSWVRSMVLLIRPILNRSRAMSKS